jgi:hypothetical protein
MDALSAAIWVSLVGTPACIVIAWWRWARRKHSQSHSWRTAMLLMGLLAASANSLLYYGWLTYRLTTGSIPLAWRLKDLFANIGVALVVPALAGAVLGRGAPRIPVGICAALGLMLWVPVAVL